VWGVQKTVLRSASGESEKNVGTKPQLRWGRKVDFARHSKVIPEFLRSAAGRGAVIKGSAEREPDTIFTPGAKKEREREKKVVSESRWKAKGHLRGEFQHNGLGEKSLFDFWLGQ